MTTDFSAGQPRKQGQYDFRTNGEADGGTSNDTMGLVTYSLVEVRSDRTLRISADPEVWAQQCPKCNAIFTVTGDATDVGSIRSDISVHITEAHSTNEDIGEVLAAVAFTNWDTTLPDGSSEQPVSVHDPRILLGERFDTVEGKDGTIWHRRRKDVYAGEPYQIRLQADRELTDDEKHQAAQLLGYGYASSVRGEGLGAMDSDTPFSFSVFADTTKSRRDDLGEAITDLEMDLPSIMENGSPLRKTDRAGVGTKDTRLVEGFGPNAPRFEIYYDSVHFTAYQER